MADKDRIVAIGPREEIGGLRTIGIAAVEAETPSEALEALHQQAGLLEVRLVLLSESVAEQAREAAEEVRRDGTMVMLVPSHRGAQRITEQWMKHAMEQRIGVDVISE